MKSNLNQLIFEISTGESSIQIRKLSTCISSVIIYHLSCVTKHTYRYAINYYIPNISVTMATAFIATVQIKVFDQSIFSIITDLKKKHKCANINNIDTEIIKTLDFQDRINTIIINEKISNKKNFETLTLTPLLMTQKR